MRLHLVRRSLPSAAGFSLSSVCGQACEVPRYPAEGAKPAGIPGFIKPQLATLKSKTPGDDQWLNEIKYDGYRVQLHAGGGRVTAYRACLCRGGRVPRHHI